MSSPEQKFMDISGIDWMICYVRWASRNLPSGSNNFSVLADVTDSFDYEGFENRISELENISTFLSGKIKRSFRYWRPFWCYEENGGKGILCSINRQDQEIMIRNKLPAGISVKAVYFEKSKKLLFTFSHAVFDGVGAEKFIAFLLQPEKGCDRIPVRSIPVNLQAMKENGRELQKVMKKFPEKQILRLPEVYKNTENCFERITIPEEKYNSLKKRVESKYGPFTLSLYIFALLLCDLEKYVFSILPSSCEYIFIPMSVDLRNTEREDCDMFFNHWSLMPLLISRKILSQGVPASVQHLRQLYSRALEQHIPQLFYRASEAMKYLPLCVVDLFSRCSPAKTLGTMMFSFLNSTHCSREKVSNLAHYPNMPYGNNLGFFVNICNGNLNIVISRRKWQDAGNFELFCKEIRKQLEEETI